MLTRSPSRPGARGAPLRSVHQRGFLGFGVGVDDLGDQAVAHDVGAGEFGEVNVVDAVEDPA